ncbi:MAG TPA: ACP S-malonyltransferase [Gemmatimonadaceae bacterium]|nr:ACP S-malonyltransferase [Gemmatimonadaceae bacterium]
MDILLLFPGQGSQKPGMAKDLVAAFPAARTAFERADGALGSKLSQLCFEGPAEDLTLTQNAQPALLAHAAAVWAVVRERLAPLVRAAAGHSLGEFSAYHAVGALPLDDAVKLVRRRGELMSEAGTARPGSMAAILGELERSIEDICAEAGAAGVVVPANYNAPGQTVISGDVAAVDGAMELATAAGAKRAVRLNVSGAFHSPLMEPARAGLDLALSAARWSDPSFPVYSNVTAKRVGNAATARELLLEQLTSTVRWVQVVEEMAAEHPGALFVEMGPGNVLTSLARRLAPNNPSVTCGTAADVEALLAKLS